MKKERFDFDLVGIGIGPMNLGLAALTEPTGLRRKFFDSKPEFHWHPGMLIPGSTMQSSFLSDLVTLADPQSRYSYLNYLKEEKRLHAFYFREDPVLTRQEYDRYLQWASKSITGLEFGTEIVDAKPVRGGFELKTKSTKLKTPNLVIGTGSKPYIPKSFGKAVIHTSEFWSKREEIESVSRIAVVGTGQSASEIFLELLKRLPEQTYNLVWIGRSPFIETFDEGRLTDEIYTPAYIEHFHALPLKKRIEAMETFDRMQNGVSPTTLRQIYDRLYDLSAEDRGRVTIRTGLEVQKISAGRKVQAKHFQTGESYQGTFDQVIVATGYRPNIPDFVSNLDIVWESEHRWRVDLNYEVVQAKSSGGQLFALTNLDQSHGPAADNLGVSPSRNQRIINQVLGREYYPVEEHRSFMTFR